VHTARRLLIVDEHLQDTRLEHRLTFELAA
jgi:hypothetical protein